MIRNHYESLCIGSSDNFKDREKTALFESRLYIATAVPTPLLILVPIRVVTRYKYVWRWCYSSIRIECKRVCFSNTQNSKNLSIKEFYSRCSTYRKHYEKDCSLVKMSVDRSRKHPVHVHETRGLLVYPESQSWFRKQRSHPGPRGPSWVMVEVQPGRSHSGPLGPMTLRFGFTKTVRVHNRKVQSYRSSERGRGRFGA